MSGDASFMVESDAWRLNGADIGVRGADRDFGLGDLSEALRRGLELFGFESGESLPASLLFTS